MRNKSFIPQRLHKTTWQLINEASTHIKKRRRWGGGRGGARRRAHPRSVPTSKVDPQGLPLRFMGGPPRPGAEGLRQEHSITQADAALCWAVPHGDVRWLCSGVRSFVVRGHLRLTRTLRSFVVRQTRLTYASAPFVRCSVPLKKAPYANAAFVRCWYFPPNRKCVAEKKREICHTIVGTRDDKQWPTEGGALKDGCTGVADASVRASWCVCRVV